MEIQRYLTNLVAHNPILRACSDETRKFLLDRGTIRRFEGGSVLFADNDPGHRLLFILGGALQMGKSTNRGRRQIMCSPEASTCGGMCLLFFGERGLAEVRGLEPGHLLVVERNEFERLALEDTSFGAAAWNCAAACMAHMNNLVTQLSFNKVSERVAMLLVDETSKDGDLVRLTQSDLAASVGTTREVVVRCGRPAGEWADPPRAGAYHRLES